MSPTVFVTDAPLPPALHARGCACGMHRRRRASLGLIGLGLLGGCGALGSPRAQAQHEGIDVGKRSSFAKLVPAEQIDPVYASAYRAALKAGVESIAYQVLASPQGLRLGPRVETA